MNVCVCVCLTDQQCVCMCVSVLIVRVCVCLTDEQCVRVSLAEGQSSDYLMQIHTDAPVNLQHTQTCQVFISETTLISAVQEECVLPERSVCAAGV